MRPYLQSQMEVKKKTKVYGEIFWNLNMESGEK